MIDATFQWLINNPKWLWGIGLSVLTVIVSAILVPIFVLRMQPDHFVAHPKMKESPKSSPFRKVIKNTIGGLLVMGGILMCFLPGQGLLTILVGLAVMDFPGKRKLEIGLFRRKPINWAINKIREKANQAPLILPE